MQGAGCRVQGAGCRVQGSGFRVQSSGFRVLGPGFKDDGSGFRVQGSGFRVQGSGFRVQAPRNVLAADDIHCVEVQVPGGESDEAQGPAGPARRTRVSTTVVLHDNTRVSTTVPMETHSVMVTKHAREKLLFEFEMLIVKQRRSCGSRGSREGVRQGTGSRRSCTTTHTSALQGYLAYGKPPPRRNLQ